MIVSAKQFSLIVIAVCLPFILWAVCGILPTFDDYTSLQSPWWVQIADPGYFFPDSVRRPFDALLGGIVGWFPVLFPSLNHVLIILGHTAAAYLVYALCQKLRMGTIATNVATFFFFFSPATLGATLACDGFNQTFAQLWGLLALWSYLSSSSSNKWLLCVLLAVLSKENGLAWAVVPPLVAYAFHISDCRKTIRDVCKGLLLAIAYMVIFALLAFTDMLEYSNEYSETSLLSHLKDFVQLMAYTWVPLDYMSAVYPPMRNWTIVIVTLTLSLPFLAMLTSKWQLLKNRTLPLLIVCFFILVFPHLLTLVSIMHNYAALSMAALIIAFVVSHIANSRILIVTFVLFMTTALFTDVRHYIAAKESGLLGKHLAQQAISQTMGTNSRASLPPSRVLCINIDNPEEPSYSSFCVRPIDAFAWGLSVRYYSHYEWKTHIDVELLSEYDSQKVEVIADSALHNGSEAVWVVGLDKENLTILTKK